MNADLSRRAKDLRSLLLGCGPGAIGYVLVVDALVDEIGRLEAEMRESVERWAAECVQNPGSDRAAAG